MLEQNSFMLTQLTRRIEKGSLRYLRTEYAPVDFFSNDYLGLAKSGIPGFRYEKYPNGSTGSRLLSGNNALTEETEAQIARFHHGEAALLFNSGYNANLGLLAAIADRNSTYLYDESCHASIIDGIRLSLARTKQKFRHNHVGDLEEKLQKNSSATTFIVVESVYSMDGDQSPLEQIAALAVKYNAALIVDEAHATGIIGPKGEGLVQTLGLESQVFARIHTFGKALGCHGAAVIGRNLLRDFLINFARPFIYTTSLPPSCIQVISGAYSYLESPLFSNERLHRLITYFREKVDLSGSSSLWKSSHCPIQALILGSNQAATEQARNLQKQGLQIQAILAPTVPIGTERLRICLHSYNTEAEIDRLFELINQT